MRQYSMKVRMSFRVLTSYLRHWVLHRQSGHLEQNTLDVDAEVDRRREQKQAHNPQIPSIELQGLHPLIFNLGIIT